jgi:hypothetical protein
MNVIHRIAPLEGAALSETMWASAAPTLLTTRVSSRKPSTSEVVAFMERPATLAQKSWANGGRMPLALPAADERSLTVRPVAHQSQRGCDAATVADRGGTRARHEPS